MDPFSAAISALEASAMSKFAGKVLELAFKRPFTTMEFARSWSMGPRQPRMGGEIMQAPEVATGIYGYGNFFQTAHGLDSPATSILLADDAYADIQRLIEEHEGLLHQSEFGRLSLTYRTATLALGLYSVVRFGENLVNIPSAVLPSRSHEVLRLADRLFDTMRGFPHQTRDYDRLFSMSNSTSEDVLQILNECTIVRALAHRRFDPNFARVARPIATGDPALWSLTRLNGAVLDALVGLRDASTSTGELDYRIRETSVANHMVGDDANKLNHRFRLYRDQPSLQASQSVHFAKGYSHLLNAASILIRDWDAPSPSPFDLARVRSACALAQVNYRAGPGIWWHSYANLFIVWSLLMYRSRSVRRYQEAILTACQLYRRTNDESRAKKIEAIALKSLREKLTRVDAIALLS